ncbi:hypothetical protein L1987_84074 [Smallanthus sonchifolius]|uniref:Uncharacterized protein n=1 Tax=Smallanthus sonchifolius TaxID=185202 RepID=A0ACB8YDT3_9ASTR|nr:hypothetical protein L1987_84074 [Smallanthus sonchifolius]
MFLCFRDSGPAFYILMPWVQVEAAKKAAEISNTYGLVDVLEFLITIARSLKSTYLNSVVLPKSHTFILSSTLALLSSA